MIRLFHHYVSKMAFFLLLLEMLILLSCASLVAAFWLDRHPLAHRPSVTAFALCFAAVIVASMAALGMYQHSARKGIRTTLVRIMPSFALGFAMLSAMSAFYPGWTFSRDLSAAIFALGALGVLLARVVVFTSAGLALLEERLIFVGGGALVQECMALAAGKAGFHQFHLLGCVPLPDEPCSLPDRLLLPAHDKLLATARNLDVDEIVVAVTNRRSASFPVDQLMECALNGIKVIDAASFFEREACQIRIDTLHPSFLIFGGGFDQSFLRASSKRAFDLLASALVGIAALPVMLVAAACISLEDGGPIFYAQERVGKHGRKFKVLKFRSMRVDAEKTGTPVWASTADPRITRVGHWIRKTRIDELPQMLNVFRGEMSFVGPRPERAYFVDQLAAEISYYQLRHRIKPGITGLAQVRYQYGASVHDAVEKLQYDLYYLKNNSLFLDLLILIDTVQVVLFGKGSR